MGGMALRQPPQRQLSAAEIMAKLDPAELSHEELAEEPRSEAEPDDRNFGLYVEHTVFRTVNTATPRRSLQWRSLLPQLATFAVVAIVVLGSIQGAKIFASTLQARSVVLGAATNAIAHLESAQSLIGQSNIAGSQQQLTLAQQGFSQAQQNLQSLGGLLNGVVLASVQGRSASSLIDAGSAITAAGQQLASFYSLSSELTVNVSGVSAQATQGKPQSFSSTAASAAGYLSAAHDDVQRASQDIQQVDQRSLQLQYRAAFAQYSAELPALAATLGDASGAVSMFSSLVGPGQSQSLCSLRTTTSCGLMAASLARTGSSSSTVDRFRASKFPASTTSMGSSLPVRQRLRRPARSTLQQILGGCATQTGSQTSASPRGRHRASTRRLGTRHLMQWLPSRQTFSLTS